MQDASIQQTGARAAIAQASYQAYVDKNRSALEALLADDFHFTSPLDNKLDRKTYFERCWPNSEQLQSFEYVHAVEAADLVVIVYEAVTKAGKRFRNTEIMTIRDGKINDVEVYFGWDIPHRAAEGRFVEATDAGT